MKLNTQYLGVEDIDLVKRYEDAGASAIIMNSLFEEQIVQEQLATFEAFESTQDSFGEALSYFPDSVDFKLGPDLYIEKIRRIKEAVNIPVIASLNGSTRGGWLRYAKYMVEAGADALELNIYGVAADPNESGGAIEDRMVEMVEAVHNTIEVPVAVKLSAYFTSMAHLARRLDEAGVAGLVLFNRFYQPDIDIENLEVQRSLRLSDSSVLLLRLRWLAILAGRVRCSLAISGGVHTVEDVIKSIMAGADAVQMVSALLRGGPERLQQLRQELAEWLEKHEYESLEQMKRSMSLLRCPDPKAYERGNYVHVLQSWQDPQNRIEIAGMRQEAARHLGSKPPRPSD